MIGSTRQVRVFVHRESVDMRKQYDALSVLVASGLHRELPEPYTDAERRVKFG